jgi:RES domain-containing protein
MQVWRICHRRHAGGAFTGEGTRLVAGRWTPKGVRAVYTAGTLSLAALEMFVDMDVKHSHDILVAVSAEIPDDVEVSRVDTKTLPRNWRDSPPPPALALIGKDWLTRADTAVLAVPSAIVPIEWNYLLSPTHPDFSRVKVGQPFKFELDERMWKA